MMFAQANSEHCRHKIFNASWTIDGERAGQSLFAMIRNTHARTPGGVLSAYSDNAAVMEGGHDTRFFGRIRRPGLSRYGYGGARPHPDEGRDPQPPDRDLAVPGRGHRRRRRDPRRGRDRPRRQAEGGIDRILGLAPADSRARATVGGRAGPAQSGRIAPRWRSCSTARSARAAFNNEFGRPNLAGYFRSFEQAVDGVVPRLRQADHARRRPRQHPRAMSRSEPLSPGALVVLGGPAMLIGLGGGAASSVSRGESAEDLDFASVQRDNPEMQRRARRSSTAAGRWARANPILLIHDVGAGGLSNAIPEVHRLTAHSAG
jgi:phosphoribosylformylglycinamidine synthase